MAINLATHPLTIGASGPEVFKIQVLLWTPENKLVADGQLGPKTERAIADFQHQAGLVVTSKLDLPTFAAASKYKYVKDIPFFQQVQMPASKFHKTKIQTVTNTVNNYGTLLYYLAKYLEVDERILRAIVAVESAGLAPAKMVIRFENHHFVKYVPEAKDRFKFSPNKTWEGHEVLLDGVWTQCHTSQDVEWRVFNYAASINKTAAIQSISMGPGQMLGRNHRQLGYQTPEAMFDAILSSNRYGVLGMVDFIMNHSSLAKALRTNNCRDLALHYNGSGQVDKYAAWIEQAFNA